ncbi:MAG: asparaginase [Bacteroidetes bacterium]|nr:asparaginase [Bacteroidota bacterium]
MKPLDTSANPILVTHSRGGITESFHRGILCVVNSSGEIILSMGDTSQWCFPRSALKYFQHIPLIVSGAFDHFGFTLKELALMCGSHNGEAMHTETAEGILQKIGMQVSDLGCGAQPPTHKKDYLNLIYAGKEPTAIHNNCSGKHAGFLAWCKFMNASTSNYLDFEHPLHKEIKKYTALFHEIPESELVIGLDGCSAPIFGMPVYNQALAYKNLVNPITFSEDVQRACNLIAEAVTTYPEMIAGSKRYCTDLIKSTGGAIIGKTGADGIYSLAIPSKKWGITIKIDDGRMGPQYNVAQYLLEALKLVDEKVAAELHSYLSLELKNWAGHTTGMSEISQQLRDLNVNI